MKSVSDMQGIDASRGSPIPMQTVNSVNTKRSELCDCECIQKQRGRGEE